MNNSNSIKNAGVIFNPWQNLRQFTSARIALGRAGISLPTAAHLDFQLAHAQARDAVHHILNIEKLTGELQDLFPWCISPQTACIFLSSAASSRQLYLQRPDWGRRLDSASREQLDKRMLAHNQDHYRYDLAFVIADGLSALAIETNAVPFLRILMQQLSADNRFKECRYAPLTIVRQGRVAIGDEIGERLGAQCVIVLIGERPGLSSPDSMGIYMTWAPQMGLTDASRNCISNIRKAGLTYQEAAFKLCYLFSEARKSGFSGVRLKDETVACIDRNATLSKNFLLKLDQ